MKQIFRFLLPAIGVFAVVWIISGWMPGAQVEKKTSQLLRWAGDRNWKKVGGLVSESYHDAWGQDKAAALRNASEAGRHFFALIMTPQSEPLLTIDGDAATWKGRLSFGGRGTALGEAMLSRASTFQQDFVFAWKRESWKPWDWKLVSVSQPEITFEPQWMP